MPAAQVTKAVRENTEKLSREQAKRLNVGANVRSVYSCQNCGASIMVSDDTMADKCDFCGTSNTKAEFKGADFPQGIIPFYITRDEAVEIFRKWAAEKSNALINSFGGEIDNIKGYYLPYQMLRGPLRLSVGANDRKYTCGGYLDGIFVSQSKALSNNMLDLAEPFDISDFEPFDFSFVAGQKALFPDVSTEALQTRIVDETSNVYRPDLAATFNTAKLDVGPASDNFVNSLICNTVYLPMYVLKLEKHWLLINGQTGRIACGTPSHYYRSSHGFLKRDNEGELKRDFREFPQYRPKRPLFYKTVIVNGKEVEKAGIYSSEISWGFLQSRSEDVMFVVALFAICASLASGWHNPFLIALPLMLLGTLAYYFYRKKEARSNPRFLTVVPKYRDGGAGSDNERYINEYKDKRGFVFYASLMVLVLLAVSWGSYLFITKPFKPGHSHFIYPEEYDRIQKERFKDYRRRLNKQTLDQSDYFIGFMAKTVQTGGSLDKRFDKWADVEFTHLDGKTIRLRYNSSQYFVAPKKFLVCRNISSDNPAGGVWLMYSEFSIVSLKRFSKNYHLMRPFKKKGSFEILEDTLPEYRPYIERYAKAIGVELLDD